jgi:hypothetical protein
MDNHIRAESALIRVSVLRPCLGTEIGSLSAMHGGDLGYKPNLKPELKNVCESTGALDPNLFERR